MYNGGAKFCFITFGLLGLLRSISGEYNTFSPYILMFGSRFVKNHHQTCTTTRSCHVSRCMEGLEIQLQEVVMLVVIWMVWKFQSSFEYGKIT